MTRRIWIGLRWLALLAAVSCSSGDEPLTQLMVVVDSSMAQISAVRVRVEGMGDPKVAMASDLSKRPLPRTVAVVHRGGPLGPIEITAEGLDGDSVVVSRRAQLSFIRGRHLVLELELEQSCVNKHATCEKDETCIAGECESSEVDSADLSQWSGKVPKHLDAGGGDADSGTGEGGGTSGRSGNSGKGGEGGMDSGGKGGSTAGAGAGGTMPPESGTGGATVTKTCKSCAFDSGTSAPHGRLTCDDGICNLHCDAGYTDADQMRGNGCEKSASVFPWKVSNVDPDNPALMAASTPSIAIGCSGTLDLGVGPSAGTVEVCGQQLQPVVVAQPSGPEVVVFVTQHLSVASGSTYRFIGARPVVFLVLGDAEIEGKLDVSAKGTSGGAGGNAVCNPGIGGHGMDADHGGGGGGGGFGTIGSSGANSWPENASGGPGGSTSVDTLLAPLRGGCPGGHGGTDDGSPASGGGAGGALQISVAGKLLVAGTIAAAGGGGAGGDDFGDGGGGGGSGGGIVLEATTLETTSTAWLAANGGGGGTGRVLNANADAGDDGAHASSSAAAGGSSSGSWGSSNGGSGAAGTTSSTPGPICSASLCGGGGGGGGAGRIVLRSAACTLAGAASPAATCSAHGS